MVNIRKFVISCNLFWGYSKSLDLDDYDNNDDIVTTVINDLIEDLEKLNLTELVIKLKDWRLQKKYHIHKEFGEVLLDDGVQYICNHN